MLKKVITAILKDVKVIDSNGPKQVETISQNKKESASNEANTENTKKKESSDDSKVEPSTTN